MKTLILFGLMLLIIIRSHATIMYASEVITFSSQYGPVNWSAQKALGHPDVYPSYGDFTHSWASFTASGQREFLELSFPIAMKVSHVAVYENYFPGAVDTIYVRNQSSGTWVKVWEGKASAAPAEARIFEVSFELTEFLADAVRIAINSPAVPGWNEIDAVAIADEPIGNNNGGGSGQQDELSLLAHYMLHGNAEDFSGNQNHGIIQGSLQTASGPGGIPGTAMYFDGQSYIEVPASASLNSAQNSISISYWLKTEAFYAGSWSSVVCKSDLGEAHYRFGLGANNAYFAFKGNLAWNLNFPYSLSDDWVFVAVSFDGQMARFYKNGSFVSEMSLPTSGTFNSEAPLYIGYDPALGIDYLKGWVSDVRIYAGALSDQQVEVVYQGGEPARVDNINDRAHLTVFPNPAVDFVSVEPGGHFNSPRATIALYDLTGRVVHLSNATGFPVRISIKDLLPGVYIIRVTQDEKTISAKLVKR